MTACCSYAHPCQGPEKNTSGRRKRKCFTTALRSESEADWTKALCQVRRIGLHIRMQRHTRSFVNPNPARRTIWQVGVLPETEDAAYTGNSLRSQARGSDVTEHGDSDLDLRYRFPYHLCREGPLIRLHHHMHLKNSFRTDFQSCPQISSSSGCFLDAQCADETMSCTTDHFRVRQTLDRASTLISVKLPCFAAADCCCTTPSTMQQ